MTEFKGIAYEPHPVSPERKAELRAQGLQIIDIAFKPADAEPAEPAPVAAPRGRKAADK
jgi:hypothetical protein